MNELSDPLKRQQPLASVEKKMYQNASARVPTATMIKIIIIRTMLLSKYF